MKPQEQCPKRGQPQAAKGLGKRQTVERKRRAAKPRKVETARRG